LEIKRAPAIASKVNLLSFRLLIRSGGRVFLTVSGTAEGAGEVGSWLIRKTEVGNGDPNVFQEDVTTERKT